MIHLQSKFRRYNKKYFGGKLPRYNVHYSRETQGVSGDEDTRRKVIRINWGLRDFEFESRTALLHEMIHAKLEVDGAYTSYHKRTGNWHGPKFEKEIKRLFKKGAYKGIL